MKRIIGTAVNKEELKMKLRDKIHEVMTSPKFGFDDDMVWDYVFFEVNDRGEDIEVEVRAELEYDSMVRLADRLDPIVQWWDAGAYFEQTYPGIMDAYIRK